MHLTLATPTHVTSMIPTALHSLNCAEMTSYTESKMIYKQLVSLSYIKIDGISDLALFSAMVYLCKQNLLGHIPNHVQSIGPESLAVHGVSSMEKVGYKQNKADKL